MRAAKQGTFDGLCGIYAILNSLDAVGVTGPRTQLHQDLFRNIVKSTPPKTMAKAVSYGFETDQLLAAARGGLRWLRRTHDIDLRISRWRRKSTDKTDFIKELSALTTRPGHAVILCFAKPGLQHWSVVAKINPHTIHLRDSGGLRHLDIDRFELERGRYRFIHEDTIVISCPYIQHLYNRKHIEVDA